MEENTVKPKEEYGVAIADKPVAAAKDPVKEAYDNLDTLIITFTIGDNSYGTNFGRTIMDAPPYIYENRMMLPLRYAAEALQMEVSYNNDKRIATFSDAKNTITVNIDTGDMELNGKMIPTNTAPQLVDDRLYVSLGVLAETLGMTREHPSSGNDLSWNQDTQTATLTKKIK
ncbi:MAG: copper amine oxidase N-terminal domain-containing protein [Tissierellia bacterium]|nr:copper amine oxidase N-terminal domain-containing protein [Tissierellia bacterium]